MVENKGMQRGFFEKFHSRRRSLFSLRMAPMIDMIFLLLIFFLVAARWRPEEDFLPFRLPAAQGQELEVGRPEPLMIYIFAAETGCEVQIGQKYIVRITDTELEANLARLMEKIKECLVEQQRFANDPVEIVCEPRVKWEYVAKIYNLFYGAGLTDITFQITESTK